MIDEKHSSVRLPAVRSDLGLAARKRRHRWIAVSLRRSSVALPPALDKPRSNRARGRPGKPSLESLFAVLLPIGGLVGAIIGFSVRAPTDKELLKHVVDGAQIGAICATVLAIAMWIGGKAAGA